MLSTHFKVLASGKPNFMEARIPSPSCFNFDYLHDMLFDYEDKQIIDLLKYGFPLAHDGKTGSKVEPKNH